MGKNISGVHEITLICCKTLNNRTVLQKTGGANLKKGVSYLYFLHFNKTSQNTDTKKTRTCEGSKTDLNEHKLLHGLHPLQQHDTRLEGSTQVFMACIRVADCQETTHTIRDWDNTQLWFF